MNETTLNSSLHQSQCQLGLLHVVSMTTKMGLASLGNFCDESCQSFFSVWSRIRFGFNWRNPSATAKAQLQLSTPTHSVSLIISAPHLHFYFNLELGVLSTLGSQDQFCHRSLSYAAFPFLKPRM